MLEALEVLRADGVIDEVLNRLKSGKEADVYLVSHAGQVVAAKVYKERNQRNFKNNAGYKEGRLVRNTRTARAMAKGSRFGQAASEDAWKSAEADALGTLFAAGLRVPQPVMFYEGVLLMELVLDPEGQPAARLIDAHLSPESANALYMDLRKQVQRMLCCELIHGDLSPYNILLGERGPTLIDFPQVVSAPHNSQAEFFFRRDLENLRTFFAATDPSLYACAGDATEIWRAYQRRELTPDFQPSGRSLGEPRKGHRREQRAMAPVTFERPAPPPAPLEEEDEFAILRQGGGERPRVHAAPPPRGGRGGPGRRGPGGGPPRQHGGGSPGGRSGPAPARHGGGRPGGGAAAGSNRSGPQGSQAPRGPREGGRGAPRQGEGPRTQDGALARHGGAGPHESSASRDGAANRHRGVGPHDGSADRRDGHAGRHGASGPRDGRGRPQGGNRGVAAPSASAPPESRGSGAVSGVEGAASQGRQRGPRGRSTGNRSQGPQVSYRTSPPWTAASDRGSSDDEPSGR